MVNVSMDTEALKGAVNGADGLRNTSETIIQSGVGVQHLGTALEAVLHTKYTSTMVEGINSVSRRIQKHAAQMERTSAVLNTIAENYESTEAEMTKLADYH